MICQAFQKLASFLVVDRSVHEIYNFLYLKTLIPQIVKPLIYKASIKKEEKNHAKTVILEKSKILIFNIKFKLYSEFNITKHK